MYKLSLPYHQKIVKKELPYTIGGGIGQSRLLMLILEIILSVYYQIKMGFLN